MSEHPQPAAGTPAPAPPPGSSEPAVSTRRLLALSGPALVIGIISALALYAVSLLAELIQKEVWTALPASLGLPGARWWPVVVLTLTGVAVGAVIRWVPGHAGPDPLRTGLVAAPLPIKVVPGLALALVIGLAGGVSLGPENPIIAINVALAVWIFGRPRIGVPAPIADRLAAAGTLGAMFGSPLAAILLMTESLGGKGSGHLFDRLFGPLVAAVGGAITMQVIGSPMLYVDVPGYTNPHPADLVVGSLIALVAALVTLLGAWAVPTVHRVFRSLRSPVLALGAGGLVLGLFGWLAGHDNITLFKGLDETKRLVTTAPAEHWGAWLILGFALIKIAAVTVAAGAGFRGGRIFPAAFIGAAVGMAVATAFPDVPQAVAIASGILGSVVIMSRDGWMSIFLGALMVNDVAVLPLLCFAMVPVWLLARNRPLMQLEPSSEPEFAALGARNVSI